MISAVTHHDRVPTGAVEAFRLRLKLEAAIRGVKLTPLSFHGMALALSEGRIRASTRCWRRTAPRWFSRTMSISESPSIRRKA
jgi:hypothetical protein